MKMDIENKEKLLSFHRSVRDHALVMPQAHMHDRHEMYFLEKGKIRYVVGNEIYILEPGDMIFVPKGELHKTTGENDGGVERLLFDFSDEAVGEECREYIEELKRDKLVRFPPEKVYKLQDIFRKMEHEKKHQSKGYVQLQCLYLREALILISRYRLKEDRTEASESYRIIQDAAKYISANFNTDLSLTFLAKKYAMSPGHFSKLFKSVTGAGLSEYINMARISAAEKLLLDAPVSVTAVATACGFNDSNYFAAVFKKLKGITPKKFAMMNRL